MDGTNPIRSAAQRLRHSDAAPVAATAALSYPGLRHKYRIPARPPARRLGLPTITLGARAVTVSVSNRKSPLRASLRPLWVRVRVDRGVWPKWTAHVAQVGAV
jgi:hypothetical protein